MAQNNEENKQIIATKVKGQVKWFNVKRGYGFVHRHDVDQDLFIHQSAIKAANPNKSRKSVGDNEEIEFDVVQGEKGLEASNVTGPDGAPVQGSQYDNRRRRNYGSRGRRGRNRNVSEGSGSRSRYRTYSGGSYKNDRINPRNGPRPFLVQYRNGSGPMPYGPPHPSMYGPPPPPPGYVVYGPGPVGNRQGPGGYYQYNPRVFGGMPPNGPFRGGPRGRGRAGYGGRGFNRPYSGAGPRSRGDSAGGMESGDNRRKIRRNRRRTKSGGKSSGDEKQNEDNLATSAAAAAVH